MKCRTCGGTGHKFMECDQWKVEEVERLKKEKNRKRQDQYFKKKLRKQQDWDEHLRKATGVRGFSALYEVLGLPTNKLAKEADIKSAYRKMSLLWHPDKHMGKDTEEEAQQKFLEIQSANELLKEGLEKGSIDGVAVSSAGELKTNNIAKEITLPMSSEVAKAKMAKLKLIKEKIMAQNRVFGKGKAPVKHCAKAFLLLL